MFRRVYSFAGRTIRSGYKVSDLALAAFGQPRLFFAAFRHITQRKARVVKSGIRCAERRESIEAASPAQPLDRSDLLSGLARQFGVLLLAEDQSGLRIGVAEVNVLSALYWMVNSARSAAFYIDESTVTPDALNFKSRMLSAKEIVVKYIQTDGTQDNIIIEPYFWQEFGGKWVSPNHKNTEAHVIYDNRLESPGLTRIVDVMGAPSFDQVWREREIDLVYTWVNHADPEWAALYQRYKAEVDDKHGNLATPRPQSDDSTALTRFHSNDELRYSLRSVAENLPWVRQIYIFSNCAAPDWLNAEHTRLRWVRHEDVIPQEYLPTFSSHVIESFLHNMPGLSRHFIYMNDDVFIGKPLEKNFFFTESGAPCLLLEPYGVVNGPITEGAADYLNAARNSASLIRDAFGFSPTRLHRHSPFSLRRDLLDEIEERWPHQIDAMRYNKFRTAQDLNIPSFLAHHYGLATGRAVLGNGNCILVKSQDIRWRLQLKRVIDKNPDTFCINEGGAAPAGKDWHRYVRIFLQTMWPDPAPWEIEATK